MEHPQIAGASTRRVCGGLLCPRIVCAVGAWATHRVIGEPTALGGPVDPRWEGGIRVRHDHVSPQPVLHERAMALRASHSSGIRRGKRGVGAQMGSVRRAMGSLHAR